MNASRWKNEVVGVKPGVWSAARHRERLKQVRDQMGAKGREPVGLPPALGAFVELTLVRKRPPR